MKNVTLDTHTQPDSDDTSSDYTCLFLFPQKLKDGPRNNQCAWATIVLPTTGANKLKIGDTVVAAPKQTPTSVSRGYIRGTINAIDAHFARTSVSGKSVEYRHVKLKQTGCSRCDGGAVAHPVTQGYTTCGDCGATGLMVCPMCTPNRLRGFDDTIIGCHCNGKPYEEYRVSWNTVRMRKEAIYADD